jgi:MFS family permease
MPSLANTATIVLLQLLVLQRIQGRRLTRVILVLSVWAVSWLMTGLCSLSPGSRLAATLVICAMAVFALGETLLQPTLPAITNDLSPDHLHGRYNAVMAGAFQ